MTHAFHYATWPEEGWWIAQLLDFELASQGRTEAEAIANLREALSLQLQPPTATRPVPVRSFEVELAGA